MIDYLEIIIAILAELTGNTGDAWDEDSTLAEDCGLDSLDYTDFAMALEERFDLIIEDEQLDSWKTLGDVREFLADSVAMVSNYDSTAG